jgi:hypothetical protein
MRARSWMAALALIGGTSILVGRGLSAQAPSPTQGKSEPQDRKDPPATRPKEAPPKPPGTHFPTIELNLVIAGLGREGCDVDVKPANPGCKFRASSQQHVPSEGRATLSLRDVEIRGADHTCTVAITVREPGQAPKTIYRGFRLATPTATPPLAASAIPSFTCYLSSRLAGVDVARPRK